MSLMKEQVELLQVELERVRTANLECVAVCEQALQAKAAAEQERDRLRAQVNALTAAISMSGAYKTSEELCDLMHSTPVQCLAAHDAEVINLAREYAASIVEESDSAEQYDMALIEYVEKLRQQDKEG